MDWKDWTLIGFSVAFIALSAGLAMLSRWFFALKRDVEGLRK